jgi:hypothetical protein
VSAPSQRSSHGKNTIQARYPNPGPSRVTTATAQRVLASRSAGMPPPWLPPPSPPSSPDPTTPPAPDPASLSTLVSGPRAASPQICHAPMDR